MSPHESQNKYAKPRDFLKCKKIKFLIYSFFFYYQFTMNLQNFLKFINFLKYLWSKVLLLTMTKSFKKKNDHFRLQCLYNVTFQFLFIWENIWKPIISEKQKKMSLFWFPWTFTPPPQSTKQKHFFGREEFLARTNFGFLPERISNFSPFCVFISYDSSKVQIFSA